MRYQRNARYGQQLLNSAPVEGITRRKAIQIKNAANQIAGTETGEYRGSWRISSSRSYSTKGDRTVTQLENTSDHASAHEWGRGAARPLQRALGEVSEDVME